jgi:hypothetical protein
MAAPASRIALNEHPFVARLLQLVDLNAADLKGLDDIIERTATPLALSQLSRQVGSRDDKRPWRSAPGSRLQRSSRSKQPDQREPDQSADLDHRAEASPDSLLCASRIRLTTGTRKFGSDKTSMGDVTT